VLHFSIVSCQGVSLICLAALLDEAAREVVALHDNQWDPLK
jgi:hypothetical protein